MSKTKCQIEKLYNVEYVEREDRTFFYRIHVMITANGHITMDTHNVFSIEELADVLMKKEYYR